ncbi:hypothetical protein E1301_Tti018209 [Triplophysa tibetana]|uniref:Uncharacterized protein n=1 Tax=Triplophysa tibetana TaxID=1572043 RepID=A0A5A9NIK0_9TELE|nr:hypothetical protein E1301_Tti018209 [Triplophysa tibetana]
MEIVDSFMTLLAVVGGRGHQLTESAYCKHSSTGTRKRASVSNPSSTRSHNSRTTATSGRLVPHEQPDIPGVSLHNEESAARPGVRAEGGKISSRNLSDMTAVVHYYQITPKTLIGRFTSDKTDLHILRGLEAVSKPCSGLWLSHAAPRGALISPGFIGLCSVTNDIFITLAFRDCQRYCAVDLELLSNLVESRGLFSSHLYAKIAHVGFQRMMDAGVYTASNNSCQPALGGDNRNKHHTNRNHRKMQV